MRRELNLTKTKIAPQATIHTMNLMAEITKVAFARHIPLQMNSRQAAVKCRVETCKGTFKQLWATLVARDHGLQLIAFLVGSKKSTQQPGGKCGRVAAKVYGEIRTLKSDAFIAPRNCGSNKTPPCMVNKSHKQLPLKILFSPGIMQSFKQRENDQIMQTKDQERFEPELHRNLVKIKFLAKTNYTCLANQPW